MNNEQLENGSSERITHSCTKVKFNFNKKKYDVGNWNDSIVLENTIWELKKEIKELESKSEKLRDGWSFDQVKHFLEISKEKNDQSESAKLLNVFKWYHQTKTKTPKVQIKLLELFQHIDLSSIETPELFEVEFRSSGLLNDPEFIQAHNEFAKECYKGSTKRNTNAESTSDTNKIGSSKKAQCSPLVKKTDDLKIRNEIKKKSEMKDKKISMASRSSQTSKKTGNEQSTVQNNSPARKRANSSPIDDLTTIKNLRTRNGSGSSRVQSSSSPSSPKTRQTPTKIDSSQTISRSTRGRNVEEHTDEYHLIYPKWDRFLYSFNVKTNQTHKLYKFERPRAYSTVVPVKDYLYCLGGVELKYNPQFGDLTKASQITEVFRLDRRDRFIGPPLLEPRKEFSACVIEDCIYVTGGCNKNDALNHCEKLNCSDVAVEWEPMNDFLNIPRGCHTTSAIDDKIFVIGGIGNRTTNQVEMYFTGSSKSKWIKLAPMAFHRGRHASVVLNEKIYVLGGEDPDQDQMNNVEYYDPTRNKWLTSTSMLKPRIDFGAYVKDGIIYAVGGDEEQAKTGEFYDHRIGKWYVTKLDPSMNGDPSMLYNILLTSKLLEDSFQ